MICTELLIYILKIKIVFVDVRKPQVTKFSAKLLSSAEGVAGELLESNFLKHQHTEI